MVESPDFSSAVEAAAESELKIYFNPFLFTIEQNNEFLARGYEVMPVGVPDVR